MKIKSCLPSLGFWILFISSIFSYWFFSWGSDILYDKNALEQRANQLFLEKQYKKAYIDFINTAKLMPLGIDKSRNYRSAANAAYELSNINNTLNALILSLKYNKKNQSALDILNNLLIKREIGYQDIKMIDANIVTNLKEKNKVVDFEYLGHQLYEKKQYLKSYEAFIQAVNLSTNKNDKSMRFVYAANAIYPTNDIKQVLYLLKQALKYKQDNKDAILILNTMLKTKQVSELKVKELLKNARVKNQ